MEILRRSAELARIPIHKVAKGDVLWSQGADRVEVLHPCDGVSYDNDNAGSIVLAVHFGVDSLVLPGDLERDGMEAMTRAPPVDVDVALAPHHGSVHSAPAAFAQWCSPQAVVISGGDATEDMARELYQALGIPAWHTATDGAIRVDLDRTPGVSLLAWCTDLDAMIDPGQPPKPVRFPAPPAK
jgi:competence protein ComEC